MSVLCFIIHGIGPQEPGFSDPLQKGIYRHLLALIRTKANEEPEKWANIKPADIVDFQTLYWASIGSDEQNNLYQKIYPELFGAESKVTKTLQLVTQLAPIRSLSITLIGDIFGYLGRFQEAIKRQVFEQLATKLSQKLQAGKPFSIILVGHSLGSVILHDLISGFLQYRYANFDSLLNTISVFTMGSPLSLFSLVAESANPERFAKWVNFLHRRDPIAFPMSRMFPTVEDVELSRLSWDPLALHALYWHHGTVHQRIAEEILKHFNKGFVTAFSPGALGNVPPEIFQPFHRDAAHAGFSSHFQDFHKIPFAELIPKAKEIDVCVVYGGHWIKQNAQYFVQALSNPGVLVRVCTLSPKSKALAGFSYHFSGMPEDDIKKNIDEGKNELIKALDEARRRTQNTGQLKIYQSLNIINHSFYRFDDVIYFVPRLLTSVKLVAPPISLVYRNTSRRDDVFSWMKQDFELLLTTKCKRDPDKEEEPDAELVFDSGNLPLSSPPSPT